MADKKQTEPAILKCVYNAPTPSFFTHNDIDYCLHMGEAYDLPADCETVQNLLAQNRLTADKK